MILNVVHLAMLCKTLEWNSSVSWLLFEKSWVKFLVVESLKLMIMGTLTFTVFCFLKRQSSKFSGIGKDSLEL